MQISIEKTDGLERNLSVSIPAKNINEKVAVKLKEISTKVKIKGFRPGKIPKNILSQRYGKHVRQEVLGDLINSSIQQAVKDNNLTMAESPEVTETKELEDGGYSFIAKLEVMPEIPEINFSSIEVETETSTVSDKDVDKMIEKLQKQKQEWNDSKVAISNGDLITIEYVSKKEGEVIYPETGKEKMGILLGESGVPDELVNAIIGKKVKESDCVSVAFPEIFNVAEMSGQTLDIEFDIVDHKKGKLPEVDESFVKSFGVDSGKEQDLFVEIKENLSRELNNTIEKKTKSAVLNALKEKVKDVIVSDKMIARESKSMAQNQLQQALQQGNQDAQLRDFKLFEEVAKERIINSLIIQNVAQSENIQVDFTKVKEKVVEISQTFENPEQIMKHYYETPNLMTSIENTVIESQVISWITDQVKFVEKEVEFDQLMNASFT